MSHQISEIDEGTRQAAMLRTAVADQARWRRLGCAVTVSVNVPASLIECADAADRLLDTVRTAGGYAVGVTLEITETGCVRDTAAFHYTSARARMYGFGLAIDDFGIGYSSLLSLISSPFTELKLDRAFVSGAAGDRNIRAALQLGVALGRRLCMIVTAEGLETEEDLAPARAAGCDIAQGFLVGRPLCAELIPALSNRPLLLEPYRERCPAPIPEWRQWSSSA